MRKIFTQEELDYIKDNSATMTYKQITTYLNSINTIKKTEKQVRNKARNINISKKKYYFDQHFFEAIDNQDKAYWLGFIYTDGYLVNNKTGYELGIELQANDILHLNKFNQSISGNFEPKIFTKKTSEFNGYTLPERAMCSIRIYSKQFFLDLINSGVVTNKTNSHIYPVVNNEYISHFIRVFFDGDGCLYYKDNRHKSVSFTNSNKEFLEYIREYINTNLMLNGQVYKENDRKYKLMYSNNNDFKKVLKFIYRDANTYLERKYQKFLNLLEQEIIAV